MKYLIGVNSIADIDTLLGHALTPDWYLNIFNAVKYYIEKSFNINVNRGRDFMITIKLGRAILGWMTIGKTYIVIYTPYTNDPMKRVGSIQINMYDPDSFNQINNIIGDILNIYKEDVPLINRIKSIIENKIIKWKNAFFRY